MRGLAPKIITPRGEFSPDRPEFAPDRPRSASPGFNLAKVAN